MAMAQPRGRAVEPGAAGGDWDGPRLQRLAERLELSEEQVAAIATLVEEGRKERLELRKEMRRLRHARQGEMFEDEPSLDKLGDLIDQIAGVQAKLQKSSLRQRLSIRELLTEEQRDKWLMFRERGGRRHAGKHFGRGCGLDCGPGCQSGRVWQRQRPRGGHRFGAGPGSHRRPGRGSGRGAGGPGPFGEGL